MTITYRDQLTRDLTPAEVDANFRHVIDSANSTFAQSGSDTSLTVEQALQANALSLLYFIPPAEHAAIKAGTSTTDVTAYIIDWLQECDNGQRAGYAPAGLYNMTTAGTITPAGAYFGIFGDGPATVFKRVASRINTANPSERMFSFTNTAATRLHLSIDDITFDGNVANQSVPSPNTEFQQAHNVNVTPADALGIAFFSKGCQHLNPVGDGFGLRGGAGLSYKAINIANCYEAGRLYSRSGICITASYDECNIVNFDGDSLQIETNTVDSGRLFHTNISNSIIRDGSVNGFDLALKGAAAATRRATCNLTNVVAKGVISLKEFDFNVTNCDLATSQTLRLQWGRYQFNGGRIGTNSSSFTAQDSSAALIENITDPAYAAKFNGVEFHNAGGVSSSTLRIFYVDNNSTPTGTKGIEFNRCKFTDTSIVSAAIRSGIFTFDKCDHDYDGAAQSGQVVLSFTLGVSAVHQISTTAAGVTNRVTLHDNFLSDTDAYLYQPPISGNAVDVYSHNPRILPGFSIGWTRYDTITAPHGSGSVVQLREVDEWCDNTGVTRAGAYPSTGRWAHGQILRYAKPETEGYLGCVCTVSGHADGSNITGANNGASFEQFGKLGQGGNAVFEDDFFGDVLADQWNGRAGTDPQCVAPAISVAAGGMLRLTTGDDAAADMATNGVQLESALNWQADKDGLVFEARVKVDDITTVAFFVGLTDQASVLEIPIQSASSSNNITTNAADAVGFMFDTAMTTDNIWLVGVANNSDATAQNTAIAFVNATYRTLRIDISSAGVATFRIDGKVRGTAMTGAVTATVPLTPVIAAFSRAAASRNIDCDYLMVKQKR